jgi:hypothetical protein
MFKHSDPNVHLLCFILFLTQTGTEYLMLLGAFRRLQNVSISFVMDVRPFVPLSAWNSCASAGQICMNSIQGLFENVSDKLKFA